MDRVRKTKIVFRRRNPGLLKPVSKITDRAKRYRANRPEVRPAGRKVCAYCGSTKNVGVHHKNGDESVNTRRNLAYACKSCNGRIAAIHKKNGIGRRTRQYNAGEKIQGAKTLKDYGFLIKIMRGIEPGDSSRAYAQIMATPSWMRSAYTKNAWAIRKPDRREEVPF
jgi:hypothetical protein